ncbi:MAG TPA: hypothetical protein ENH87_11075 [Pricia antarctica]|uniref:Uncharacterized protein n=1 Tax=Pricia antarctica TaxID=641691 RepID=A0A831QR06_9FLAO|nr:hypothetical protein [Pricia antarctica]
MTLNQKIINLIEQGCSENDTIPKTHLDWMAGKIKAIILAEIEKDTFWVANTHVVAIDDVHELLGTNESDRDSTTGRQDVPDATPVQDQRQKT